MIKRRMLGLFLSLLSGATIATSAVFFKMASTVTSVQQFMLTTALAFWVVLPEKSLNEMKHKPQVLDLKAFACLALYGMFSFFAAFLCFVAFENLSSAGDTLAIGGSYLVWTMILARLFLNERHNVLEVILALIAFIGVLLLARPSFLFGTHVDASTESRGFGVLAALLSAISTAGRIVTSRKLGNVVSTSSQVLATTIASCIVLPIYSVINRDSMYLPCFNDIGFAFLSSLGMLSTTILCILALRFERSGPVAMAYSLQSFFAYVFDILIFNITPNITSIVGATLVLLGGLGPLLSNLRNALQHKAAIV